jgi:hypothetical protein
MLAAWSPAEVLLRLLVLAAFLGFPGAWDVESTSVADIVRAPLVDGEDIAATDAMVLETSPSFVGIFASCG